MSFIEEMDQLHISLHDIKLATDRFSDRNCIAKGGFGKVYKGVSEEHGEIAVKRLDQGQGQGEHEFKMEIALLSKHKHKNIVSLLGFCDEDGEKILVYKYESNGSLDTHLHNEDLTWIQRVHICLDVACGLSHVHENNGSQRGLFHRDVKSSNILLDEKWNGKVSDFGLSRVEHGNMESSFAISNVCGTHGYIAPEYYMNGYLTQKSDVYSFGVVLWEVLCGRHALVSTYTDDRRFLTVLVHKHLKKGTLYSIIPSHLRKQIKLASLLAFAETAYQCLKNAEERPTMKQVVEQLQKALDLQRTSPMSLTIEEVKHLQRIPLQDIHSAVKSFDSIGWNKNFLCQVTSEKHGCIAVWQLDRPLGIVEFMREIAKAAELNNGNIVSLHGFCDEGMEKYLVFKDERNTPLNLWRYYELMSSDLKIMHPPPL